MAVTNMQAVAALWTLGPDTETHSSTFFSMAPSGGLLSPGQRVFVQACTDFSCCKDMLS